MILTNLAQDNRLNVFSGRWWYQNAQVQRFKTHRLVGSERADSRLVLEE